MKFLRKLLRLLFLVYELFIFFPIMAVITIATALTTILMCAFFNDKTWGFYPAKIWARLMCYLSFVRVKVHGKENIEKSQSYVFVANHQSMYDIYAIYGWISVPFKWVMKKELEKIPFVGRACKSAGHIFISRGQSKAALQCIDDAKKKLVDGLSVVIFPEGSRTYDGTVGTFKRGAFQIASDLQLPIIPVTIKGAFEVMPRNSFIIHPGTIELFFHPTVNTNNYANQQTDLIESVRKTIINNPL
jgi:1-acyl-sn-glycerol-3-phosphate acyltransferase